MYVSETNILIFHTTTTPIACFCVKYIWPITHLTSFTLKNYQQKEIFILILFLLLWYRFVHISVYIYEWTGLMILWWIALIAANVVEIYLKITYQRVFHRGWWGNQNGLRLQIVLDIATINRSPNNTRRQVWNFPLNGSVGARPGRPFTV